MHIIEISLSPGADSPGELVSAVAAAAGIPASAVTSAELVRKSLDARNRRDIRWTCRVRFTTAVPAAGLSQEPPPEPGLVIKPVSRRTRAVVVGMGPAGIFAALSLAASGVDTTIIERGRRLDERAADVERFLATGVLDRESNIQYGEGGAGTFSDGKLTARTQHPYYRFVIDELVAAGAPEEIRWLAKPHVGTDRLRTVLRSIRGRLESLGVAIRFGERVDRLLLDGTGRVRGVGTTQGSHEADHVVLAMGYSARDTLASLIGQGVAVEPKGFAMGYRVEFPQARLDEIRHGRFASQLPPAEFFVTEKIAGLDVSVYSFCMCPGGTIVPASSEDGGLVLNGMSNLRRDGRFGNAAIVVSFPPALWHNEKLGGMVLQEQVERQAFTMGGGGFVAPAAGVKDFIAGRVPSSLPPSSYPLGLKPAPVWECFQGYEDAFRTAMRSFNRRLDGLFGDDAILAAPESRTSSPWRILRTERGESASTPGLYPCGEGAGYAGGIVTSAVDGLKVADHIKEGIGYR